ncbi:3a protein [Parietaria mottle virus]|uniref:Movement protein n=1 Tax=Parietaria mottle virus TaxID=64958 RepID=Q80851_9BROM|nr:3a protein [Parietaria mottle virus]AAA80344.1 3a protein [Parietaria mottle virus]QYA72573.1 3a protein [Parietaria mottle virus]
MAFVPTKTALTFSAEDESGLEKAVSDALSGCVELNMGIRRCAAFPAINQDAFLCELTTKEAKGVLRSLADKVRGRMFVDHAVIHLMYIPVILDTTHAVADLKLKNLATGDELYGGTKVNLNEAFILTMTWPRSLFADAVNEHKGLYLGGTISCSSSVPRHAKVGMWYPLWTEKVSNKQLYQKTVALTNTRAIETFARTMIHSDKEMRSLLRSRASTDIASKRYENPVLCSSRIGLMDNATAGIDFTVNRLEETAVDDTDPTGSDVLVPRSTISTDSKLRVSETLPTLGSDESN